MPQTIEITNDDQVDLIFSALANPTRRAIVMRLLEGDATVGELAQPFSMSPPAVTRHLKVLEAAGLMTRKRKAQFWTCRIETTSIDALVEWANQCRSIWETSLDRLESRLAKSDQRNFHQPPQQPNDISDFTQEATND